MTLFDHIVPFPQPEPHRADPVGQDNQEPPVRHLQTVPALIPCKLIVSCSPSVPWDVVLPWEGVQTGQQVGSHGYSVRSDCLFQGTTEGKACSMASLSNCLGCKCKNLERGVRVEGGEEGRRG